MPAGIKDTGQGCNRRRGRAYYGMDSGKEHGVSVFFKILGSLVAAVF
jgi:hypothetical protein